ncbi:MAG TPA: hypothetical protein VGK17_23385, partial [Propionicimonas sp.]
MSHLRDTQLPAVAGMDPEVPPRAGRRGTRTRLSVGWLVLLVVVPLALASAAGIVLTWPPSTSRAASSAGLVNVGVQYFHATVTSATETTCQGTQENVQPDGTVPQTVPCLRV